MRYFVLTFIVCIPLIISCTPAKTDNPNASGMSQTDLPKTDNFTRILKILNDNPTELEPYLVTDKNFYIRMFRTELFDVFNVILKNDVYRNHPEIRLRLRGLSENHPFTDIKARAQLVLSDFSGDKIPPMFRYSRELEGYEGLTPREINKDMEYCAPPLTARRPDFEYEAETKAETLRLSGVEYVRPHYRFEVPLQFGALSGGYYSIQGVGLSYKQNITPYKTLDISATNNRYVMASSDKDTYWLIDGPHHMVGGGSISKLIETQKGVDRYLHRVLPSGVSQIFTLSDGSIFITFVNLDPSKRGGSTKDGVFKPFPLENYNPPVIFYPDGTISLACTVGATKF